MFRPLLASALLPVALAACQAGEADEPAFPEATDTVAENVVASVPMQSPVSTGTEVAPELGSTEADDTTCGADKVSGRWLNALPTEDVKSEIAQTVGERPIRYYTQGDPITMDFSPARLNVELGEDGRIKLFRCG